MLINLIGKKLVEKLSKRRSIDITLIIKEGYTK